MSPVIPTHVRVIGEEQPETPDIVAKFSKYNSGNGFSPAWSVTAPRNTVIILQGYWRTADRDSIKSINPDCKVLCYVNYTRIYTGTAEAPYGNSIWNSTLRPQYLSGVADVDAGGQVAKIDHVDYADDALDTLISRFQGTAWDGVMLDDLNHNGDGYLTAATWRAELQGVNAVVGPGLEAAGIMAVPNMTAAVGQHNVETGGWVEDQFQYFDGGLFEFFTVFPPSSTANFQPQNFIDEDFAVLGRQAALGKWCLCDTIGDHEAKALWGCALVLLQTQGTATYSTHINDFTEGWYANVHDKAASLGAAIGNKFSIGTKQWRRNFENGYVTADLNAHTGTINLT